MRRNANYEAIDDYMFDEDDAGAFGQEDFIINLDDGEEDDPIAEEFEDEIVGLEEADEESETVQLEADEDEFVIPGSAAKMVREKTEDELKEQIPEDQKDWPNHGNHAAFVVYLSDKLNKIPQHSGTTTVGIERAIAYLKSLDAEISRAVRTDLDSKIAEEETEKLRDQIADSIERLDEALEKIHNKKKNKKAAYKINKEVFTRIGCDGSIKHYIQVTANDTDTLLEVEVPELSEEKLDEFVEAAKVEAEYEPKEIVKSAHLTKVYLVADPFLHAIARIIINAHITHGKPIKHVYSHMREKYKFTDREELSIQELLTQKGIDLNKDLGMLNEEFDPRASGIDHSKRFYA